MGEAAIKEPSMEDILSSIRKIIAEEGSETKDSASDTGSADVGNSAKMQDGSNVDMREASAPVVEPVASSVDAPSDVMRDEALPVMSSSDASTFSSLQEIAKTIIKQPEMTSVRSAQAGPAPTVEPQVEAAEIVQEAPQPLVTHVVRKRRSGNDRRQMDTQTANQEVAAAQSQPEQEPRRVEMAEASHAPIVSSDSPSKVEAPDHIISMADSNDEAEAFRGALMSPSADNAVTSSLERLKRSALDDMDAKTESILRPMLREWLDENLPGLVERLVREEIERVARGV